MGSAARCIRWDGPGPVFIEDIVTIARVPFLGQNSGVPVQVQSASLIKRLGDEMGGLGEAMQQMDLDARDSRKVRLYFLI